MPSIDFSEELKMESLSRYAAAALRSLLVVVLPTAVTIAAAGLLDICVAHANAEAPQQGDERALGSSAEHEKPIAMHQMKKFIDCSPNPVSDFRLSHDGTLLATRSNNSEDIVLWNTESGERTTVLAKTRSTGNDEFSVFAFNPTNDVFYTSFIGEGRSVVIRSWDVKSGKPISDVETSISLAFPCNEFAISLDGQFVAVPHYDGKSFRLHIYEATLEKLIHECVIKKTMGFTSPSLMSVLSAGEAGEFVSCCFDESDLNKRPVVSFWDQQTGLLVKEWECPAGLQWASISRDGSRLALKNDFNGTVEVWDTKKGEVISTENCVSRELWPRISRHGDLVAMGGHFLSVSQNYKKCSPSPLNFAGLIDREQLKPDRVRWVGLDPHGQYAGIAITASEATPQCLVLCTPDFSRCVGAFSFLGDNGDSAPLEFNHLSTVQWSDNPKNCIVAVKLSPLKVMIGNCQLLERWTTQQQKLAIERREAAAQQAASELRAKADMEAALAKQQADQEAAAALTVEQKAKAQADLENLTRSLRKPSWADCDDLNARLNAFLAVGRSDDTGAVENLVNYGSPENFKKAIEGDRFDREDASEEGKKQAQELGRKRFNFQTWYSLDPYGEKEGRLTISVKLPFRCVTSDHDRLTGLTYAITDMIPSDIWFLESPGTIRPCEGQAEVNARREAGQELYVRENMRQSELLLALIADREILKRVAREPDNHVVNVCVQGLRKKTPDTEGFFRIQAYSLLQWDTNNLRRSHFLGLNGSKEKPTYFVTRDSKITPVIEAEFVSAELIRVDPPAREVVCTWGAKK